jgi:hypothetical protein
MDIELGDEVLIGGTWQHVRSTEMEAAKGKQIRFTVTTDRGEFSFRDVKGVRGRRDTDYAWP